MPKTKLSEETMKICRDIQSHIDELINYKKTLPHNDLKELINKEILALNVDIVNLGDTGVASQAALDYAFSVSAFNTTLSVKEN